MSILKPPNQESCTHVASERAYAWLLNARVHPEGIASFLRSYEGGDVCYTYDQAVAVFALLAKGDPENAKRLLNMLAYKQQSSGSWYTAYTASTGEPQEYNQHVGPVLWAALAARHYELHTGEASFQKMARQAIEWTQRFQDTDGGVNGGIDYDGHVIMWCSTEHQLDAYVAYKAFGYEDRAKMVADFLASAWNPTEGRFHTGRRDRRRVLDVNTWGVLALEPKDKIVPQEGFAQAVRFCEESLSFRDPGTGLRGHDFSCICSPEECPPHDPFSAPSPVDDIWFEGSAQLACAYHKLGEAEQRKALLGELQKAQRAGGGLPYSLHGTHNGMWKMETAASVAATAWFVLAVAGVNPFAESKG